MLPEIPGVKTAYGLARVAGDHRLYARLLLHFAHQFETTIADFESALGQQDHQRLRDLAHKLKGVAANLGAEGVEQDAARLEHWASQPGSGRVADLYPPLRAGLQALSQRILEQLQGWAEPVCPSTMSQAELLQKLLGELQAFDGDALDSWSQLAQRLRGRLPDAEIARLDGLVLGFDFPSARRILQTISGPVAAGESPHPIVLKLAI